MVNSTNISRHDITKVNIVKYRSDYYDHKSNESLGYGSYKHGVIYMLAVRHTGINHGKPCKKNVLSSNF